VLFDLEYNLDKGYVLTRAPQLVLLADVFSNFDRIISDRSIQQRFFEIVDFSNTKELNFGYEEVRNLMPKIAELKRADYYQGSLLIANSDYVRGMTNIYRVVGKSADINIIQVASFDDALVIVDKHIAR